MCSLAICHRCRFGKNLVNCLQLFINNFIADQSSMVIRSSANIIAVKSKDSKLLLCGIPYNSTIFIRHAAKPENLMEIRCQVISSSHDLVDSCLEMIITEIYPISRADISCLISNSIIQNRIACFFYPCLISRINGPLVSN